MAGESAADDREQQPLSSEQVKTLSNAELTREIAVLRRQNIDLTNQVLNLNSKVAKLERDVRAAMSRRH
jgi:hypothetical protein